MQKTKDLVPFHISNASNAVKQSAGLGFTEFFTNSPHS